MEFGAAIRSEFLLEDGVTFLNHGSFGATPRAVLAAQDDWRARLERQPVRFMQQELPGALRNAAGVLAGFLGGRGDDLVFVENATTGINAVARSLVLAPGDEVLTTDHAYPAIRNTLAFVCERSGATLVEARVPFPVADAGAVVAAVAAAISDRTRVAVLDHITSHTAVVFPVRELVALCRSRGVAILVDGAHAPGAFDLNLAAIGADWYVGNAHKWLFAPKGCGFLWAPPDRHDGLHPTVISHGFGEGFTAEFDWIGTRDPSAWLTAPEAIAFHRRLGSERVMAHNAGLAASAAETLVRAWRTEPGAPQPMHGAMATVRVPGAAPATADDAERLHCRLVADHGIEVPVFCIGERLWVRISAQVYNHVAEYDRLADAMAAITGRL